MYKKKTKMKTKRNYIRHTRDIEMLTRRKDASRVVANNKRKKNKNDETKIKVYSYTAYACYFL